MEQPSLGATDGLAWPSSSLGQLRWFWLEGGYGVLSGSAPTVLSAGNIIQGLRPALGLVSLSLWSEAHRFSHFP